MYNFRKRCLVVLGITVVFLTNIFAAFNPIRSKTVEESPTNEDSSFCATRYDDALHYSAEEMSKQWQEYHSIDFWKVDTPNRSVPFDGVKEYGDFVADKDSMEVIIGVNDVGCEAYDNIDAMIDRFGGRVINTVSIQGSVIAIVVDIPLDVVSSFKKEVQVSRLARYMEPNVKVQMDFVPNDANWTLQWGPQKIQADWAWNTTVGSRDVLVAVIDTGIDYNHPDLAANYVPLGYDWVNGDADPKDDNGHGTHCAGIIAAVLNNSEGISGLAQVSIMAEKAFNSGGMGEEVDIAKAIIHAVDNGADILSNSYGTSEDLGLIHEAMQYAYNCSVLSIAAAGNEGSSAKHYPAAYDEVVAVTALDESDNPAWFTNYGDWVEVAAPGVKIFSTLPTYNVTLNGPGYNRKTNYDYLSGTSMACPHAAGMAALIWSRFPNATRDWVRAQLKFTADDLGPQCFDEYYGYGRVNARKAVEQAPQGHELLISNWKKPSAIQPEYTATFSVTVTNFGTSDETNVTVQFFVDENLEDSVAIDYLETSASSTVNFSWSTPEERTYNVTFYIIPVPGEEITENNAISSTIKVQHFLVALFDNDIWVTPPRANEGILSSLDIPYVVFRSSAFGNINLSSFAKVIIAQFQDDVFYNGMDTYRWWFEDYVRNGGVLEIHAPDVPSMNYTWRSLLPGGIVYNSSYRYHITIVDPDHPAVTIPNRIANDELQKWEYQVDGYFSSYPENSHVVIEEDSTGYPVYLEIPFGAGKIIASSQSLEWYSSPHHPFRLMLENSILYTPNRYSDELIVSLQTPSMPQPEEKSAIEATVYNCGSKNETNVQLQLLIDSMVVNEVAIAELPSGTFFTIHYPWTPSTEATYNITAYAQPVPNENITRDNIRSNYAIVQCPLIKPIEGQYACYSLVYENYPWHVDSMEKENYTYEHYLEPYEIRVEVTFTSSEGYIGSSYSIVDIVTRWVETGTWGWNWWPMWIETNLTIGSKINLMEGTAEVKSSKTILVGPRAIDCWEIPYGDADTFWYDKVSGLLVCMELNFSGFCVGRLLTDTNIPLGIQCEHDLGVTLEAPQNLHPGETSLLNATVHNVGLKTEIDVTVYLLIDGTQVASEILNELANGTCYTLSYSWNPTSEGIYSITVRTDSVPDETVMANNVGTRMVFVFCPKVALIFEGQEVSYLDCMLDSLQIGHDTYCSNGLYHYTENSSLLIKYKIVIFIKPGSDRPITYTEYLALESYLSRGGSLLVTGAGCLSNDIRLAWVVRSSSMDEDYGQPDLYVVDATHPIMDGPYGSFPEGYLVSGLYDECSKAEADTARNAVAVAELADGYDKIIATKGLLGKVVFWNGEGTYDWALSNDCKAMFKNLIRWFASETTISIIPSAGSPGCKVTVTGTDATTNGTVSIYWDDTIMGNTTANNTGDFSYLLTVPESTTAGIHTIIALDNATGITGSRPFRMIVIAVNPTEGPTGTKVAVNGIGFPSESQVAVKSNDMFIGYATVDNHGEFTFIFCMPLSAAGTQIIKASYAEGYAFATFSVIDLTPLSVQVDVGVVHFVGEIAEFYTQTTFNGQTVNATITSAVLYKPDGTTENLTIQPMTTGLCKIPYTILENETGTYTLVITASYVTDTIRSNGTSFRCFLVSQTLTLMNRQIAEIKDGIAIIQTDLGFVKLNLTAMNATLENIFLNVIAINGTAATIQTTIGIMNGTITSIKDNIANIVVPGLGQIETNISNLKGTQDTSGILQYVTLTIALLAAASSVLSLIFLRRSSKDTHQGKVG